MIINNGLFESATVQKVKGGIQVRIRLISAGEGSSGTYTADMLRENGPKVFPKGTKLYYNHPTEQERETHRDVRLIFGKTLDAAEYVEAEQALYADAFVYEKDAEFITQIMDDVDLSIEASGKVNSNGEAVLAESPINAVALVPTGGRDGKIVGLIESHLNEKYAIMENDNSSKPKEFVEMTTEEMKALLTEALESFGKTLVESLTAKPDVEETSAVKDLVKALDGADLPEADVDKALESPDPLAAIESLKEFKARILESVKPAENQTIVTESGTGGYVVNEAANTARKTVGAWN